MKIYCSLCCCDFIYNKYENTIDVYQCYSCGCYKKIENIQNTGKIFLIKNEKCIFKNSDHEKIKMHCKHKCKLFLSTKYYYWIYNNIYIGHYDWNNNQIFFNDIFDENTKQKNNISNIFFNKLFKEYDNFVLAHEECLVKQKN